MTKIKDKQKDFLIVYQGGVGKKASSLKEAVRFAKEYIVQKNCKHVEVYQIVKSVK